MFTWKMRLISKLPMLLAFFIVMAVTTCCDLKVARNRCENSNSQIHDSVPSDIRPETAPRSSPTSQQNN